MTHEEWLAARRLGISGTDIAVLLGINKYKSEDDLILDKLGVGKGFSGNAATRAGQLLEPHVANAWSKREQVIIINGAFTIHPNYPRFIGTTDFLTTRGVLEIKTGAWDTWKKGMPPMYEAQLRWYLGITERPVGDLVACIVPKDRSQIPTDCDLLEWVQYQQHCEYQIERDLDWEDRAFALAERFLARLDSLKTDGQKLKPPTLGSPRPF